MIALTRVVIRVSLLIALTAMLSAAPPEMKPNLDGFDAFMAKAMLDCKVPGAAVAIVQNGKIVLAKGYGYRDVGKKLPITGKTLFPIASITKSFTVTALGTLVDQGRLEWDKPVREYLADFRMSDPVATEQLTPRDLVTHRSGLPRHDLIWYSSSFSREQLVARLRYLELSKPIRSTFQYNNLMFLTAGYLGGHIIGSSWEELVQHSILNPLGMNSTRFSSQDARKSSDYALPYRKNRKTEVVSEIEFSRWGDVGPAGSINSCIDDMSKYLLLHLNHGKVEGKQLLGKNTSEQMQSPQMVIQGSPLFPELSEAAYGMGFLIDTYRGHKHVSHGGNLDGFSAQLSFLPNNGIGVVILTNLDGAFLRDLVPYYVYDQLLGLGTIDWVQRFLDIEHKARDQELTADKKGYTGQKPGTHPSHEIREYEGEFENPGYGKLWIRFDPKNSPPRLVMKLNDVERPLEHFHYDTFQVPANPLDPFEKLRITFPTDAQGELSTLEATLEPRVKPIVFTRVAEQQMFQISFLRRFVGDYDTPGQPLTASLAGENSLQMHSPGEPPRKLIPRHGTRFDAQDLTGVSLEFKQDSTGTVQEIVLYTPDTVLAVPKKK